jgi:hypothetical protein
MIYRLSETGVILRHSTKLREPKIHFPAFDEEVGTVEVEVGARRLTTLPGTRS